MMKNSYKLVFILVLLVLLLLPIVKYGEVFLNTIDIQEYADKYSASQYILGEKAPAKISDSGLYVYAGYAYWQGEDPTTINFEHPPLAKYGIGLFHRLFANPYWFSLCVYAGVLILFYGLACLVVQNSKLQVAAVICLGLFSLFQVHTRYALLDLPLLFGYLLFFYGLLANLKYWKRVAAVGLGLGIALTVKYPIPMTALLFVYLLFDSWKRKQWLDPIIGSMIAIGVYFLSYISYFMQGHNILDWLAFEKYRFSWFLGKTDARRFLIFQTLFTGRFRTWWDEQQFEATQYWSLAWPLVFVGSVAAFVKSLINKHYRVLVLLSFSFLQLLIYGLGAAASDRFFITLLPFWLLGSVYLVEQLILSNKPLNLFFRKKIVEWNHHKHENN